MNQAPPLILHRSYQAPSLIVHRIYQTPPLIIHRMDVQHQHEYEGDFDGTPVNLSPLQQHGRQDTDSIKYVDEDFFAALDRISDDNMKYWDMCVQKKIEELEQYHNGHPAFVTDEKRAVVVQVTNSVHRGSSGLLRVSMEEYLKRTHKREEKALELCKLMRDCIEELEASLLDSKARIMKMHGEIREKLRKFIIFDIRYMKVQIVVNGC